MTVGVVGGACTDVTQVFYEVSKFEKREKLGDILMSCNPKDRTLVFVKTKKNADFLATYLSHQGLPTTSIHGENKLFQQFFTFKKTNFILQATGFSENESRLSLISAPGKCRFLWLRTWLPEVWTSRVLRTSSTSTCLMEWTTMFTGSYKIKGFLLLFYKRIL